MLSRRDRFLPTLTAGLGGLPLWVALAKQLVFRIFAARLAFLPAANFWAAAATSFTTTTRPGAG